MRINTGMKISLGIHILQTILLFLDEDYFYLGFFVLSIVLANIIGFSLIKSKKIIGYKVFIISCFILVPIGIIGVFAARKELDSLKEKRFKETIND